MPEVLNKSVHRIYKQENTEKIALTWMFMSQNRADKTLFYAQLIIEIELEVDMYKTLIGLHI